MQVPMLRRVALIPAVVVSAMVVATMAHAQITPGPSGMIDPGSLLRQGASMAPKTEQNHTVAPPALPGAVPHDDTAAPATQIPADMSPNAALFDAINRGDLAAAHDALNRGAVLSARNVLGMTPMELAVDLGRNDIAFLLMSYRGADSPNGPQGQAQAVAAAQPGKAADPAARAHKNVVRVKDVVPAPQQTPRLFANDGGTPVPSAGFLGFDAGRPLH